MKEGSRAIKTSMINLVILIILYAIFYVWLDLPIATWLHNEFPGTFIYVLANDISKIFKPEMWLILAVIVGLIGYFSKTRNQKKSYYLFSASVILAYIICGILKVGLARYRPIEFFSNQLYGFHFFSFKDAFNSTPSGATMVAFAGLLALGIIVNKNWLTILLIVVAILIGVGRLIIGQHYPGDVILGAYLGILSVYWAGLKFKKVSNQDVSKYFVNNRL